MVLVLDLIYIYADEKAQRSLLKCSELEASCNDNVAAITATVTNLVPLKRSWLPLHGELMSIVWPRATAAACR